MPDLVVVLALADIPAIANLAGGLLAELRPVSDRTLSLALHGAGEKPEHHRLDLRGPGLVPAALRAGKAEQKDA